MNADVVTAYDMIYRRWIPFEPWMYYSPNVLLYVNGVRLIRPEDRFMFDNRRR